MELIDKEMFSELSIKHIPVIEDRIDEYSWYTGYVECLKVIDNTPTIDAIPIDWIKMWLEKTKILTEKSYYYYDVSVYDTIETCVCIMLEDWRKENE